MRKIKSVKLNKEFNNGVFNKAIGTHLEYQQFYGLYKLNYDGVNACYYTEEDINKNTAGLFAIEYEPEGFEFVSFPQTVIFNNKLIINTKAISELNRLADWCDGQSEKDKDEAILFFAIYANPKNELKISSFMFTINQGLKFNSQKSAKLFLSELNKPENSDYKNYFIELLKKTRL